MVGAGRCRVCVAKADRARGSAAARGYDGLWARYSREWLARFPWCGLRGDGLFHMEHSRCARNGERVAATVTDHIVAMKAGGARFDPRNHQSLCRGCNNRKSIEHEGGFGR